MKSRHFSNELAPVPLEAYDSWESLTGVTYRTRITSAIRAVSRTNYFRKTGGGGGAQNEKRPNRGMKNYLKIGK